VLSDKDDYDTNVQSINALLQSESIDNQSNIHVRNLIRYVFNLLTQYYGIL